jgi:hypothetical protein
MIFLLQEKPYNEKLLFDREDLLCFLYQEETEPQL